MAAPSSELSVKKLESLWLQHKDTLHRLYIIENKTLGQVKRVMESVHEFPVLRLHDYEVALRQVLKLRKNFKREDWYSIGMHVSGRKMQGKESEVLWNNIPLAPRKVRKDILRNRNLGHLCHRSRRTELPAGVVIRTPPGSPSGQLAVIISAQDHSSPEPATLMSSELFGCAHRSDTSVSDIHSAPFESPQIVYSRFRQLRTNLPFNRLISELLNLVKSGFLIITLPVERTWTPGPRLFGGNPSLDILARFTFQLSNQLWLDWTSDEYKSFISWLGASADFKMLRAFFSVKSPTVCATYEALCNMAFALRQSTVARVLFEICDTMKENNPFTFDGIDFLNIAVSIGSGADGMLEVAKRAPKPSVSWCARVYGTRGQCVPRLFLLAAARRDIAMMRTLVGAIGECHNGTHFQGDAAAQRISLIMRQVYAWDPIELKDGYTIADYIQLLVQGRILITNLSARCCYDDRPKVAIRNPDSITIDELVMMCPPTKRSALYSAVIPWSCEHRTLISRAGIFNASLNGATNLMEYLRSRKRNSEFELGVTMQECLLFAASLNDTQTTSALIQLGVDHKIGLLSNNQEQYHKGSMPWDPMIVAAAAGSLETLHLLSETNDLGLFLTSAPVYEICQLEDSQTKYWDITGRELRRLENLRRHYLCSQTWVSHATVTNGTVYFDNLNSNQAYATSRCCDASTRSRFFLMDKRRMEVIKWIRTIAEAHGVGAKIDREIIDAALYCDPKTWLLQCTHAAYQPCDALLMDGILDANLEYHEGDMDLLQLCIRAQCSLKVVESLLSKGLRVHSRASTQSGNTMLHDALLSWSRDRSNIVHLLLREGADPTSIGEGLTVLEASLHRDFEWSEEPFSDYLDIFTHLLESGAPVQHGPRLRLPEWQPLICQLVHAGAEDDLILRVADAGADLNVRGRGCYYSCTNWSPLATIISSGRETLARGLILRGADVHTPADDGENWTLTALQAACWVESSIQFIEYLVNVQGANVNEPPSEKGITALQCAVWGGSLSLVELLLDKGADVNALSGSPESDEAGRPMRFRALDLAVARGHLDMVELLLKAGGRSITDILGGAIDRSKAFGHYAILSVLLEWEMQHGRRMLKEEAEWQQQHPDEA